MIFKKTGAWLVKVYFLRYKSNIKIGTHIINVAASGDTPNISATRSLIACTINFPPYTFYKFFFQ